MAVLIGTLAMFVALGALWLASENGRRVHENNRAFAEAHLKDMRETLRQCVESVETVRGDIAKLDRRIEAAERAVPILDKQLRDAEKALAEVDVRLVLLDKSVPAKFRVRMAPDAGQSARTA